MSDNTHAAMCVYCGESIIYDAREVTDMAAAHAQIIEHDQQCPKNPMVDRLAFLNQQNTTLQEQNDALAAHMEKLSSNALALADACENKADLPLHKWAVKCAMLVSRVQASVKELPSTGLARRDALKEAETVEKWADCLESIIRHVEAEHSKDPNYPAIGAEGMGEFAADMRTEAENLRKKAEAHQ